MNSEEIKDVEKELWGAADTLRAESKLTAAEYKDPVLGLILLRFAENRFDETLKQIEKTFCDVKNIDFGVLMPKCFFLKFVAYPSTKSARILLRFFP